MANGREHITKSRNIAMAMGVSAQTAAKYRRVFHALGLIDDIPGQWNPDNLKGFVPKYDANGDDVQPGYSAWCEYNDYNDPAEVWVHFSEPDSFAAAVADLRRDQPVDLFVVSRAVPLPTDNESLVRRTASVPQPFWIAGRRSPSGWSPPRGPSSGCLTPVDNNTYLKKYSRIYRRETNDPSAPWIGADTVSPLAVVPQINGGAGPPTARSAAGARCLPTENVTIADLTEHYDWSRATAYRRIKDWVAAGDAIQMGRGRYKVLVTGVEDEHDLTVLRTGDDPRTR